jgi:hypothetical protein
VDVSFGTIWEAIARDQGDNDPTGKLELAQIRRLASGESPTPQP